MHKLGPYKTLNKANKEFLKQITISPEHIIREGEKAVLVSVFRGLAPKKVFNETTGDDEYFIYGFPDEMWVPKSVLTNNTVADWFIEKEMNDILFLKEVYKGD